MIIYLELDRLKEKNKPKKPNEIIISKKFFLSVFGGLVVAISSHLMLKLKYDISFRKLFWLFTLPDVFNEPD